MPTHFLSRNIRIIKIMEGDTMIDGVKIKELPRVGYTGLSDTDLMAVELSDDTYSITIGDLLVVFSADKKILALQNELKNLISKTEANLVKSIQSLSDTIELMETALEGNETWQTEAKEQILNIKKSISNIEDLLDEHEKTMEDMGNTIESMSQAIATNTDNISDLQKLTETHSTSIGEIKNDIADTDAIISSIDQVLDEYMESTNKTLIELQKTDSDNKVDLKKIINEKYDDIMKYIDYYHHCEAAPPNFDEPCYYEKELTGYCYPIHSLYHTTDDNWNPLNHHIPGDWILRTQTTLDGDVVEYIYERIR